MKNSHFSLYEKSLTNETVTITYKPINTVSSYSYKIYKDGALFDEVKVANSKTSTILLEESGDYSIQVSLHFKVAISKASPFFKEEIGM